MVSRWVSASSKWTSETKKKSRRVGSGRKALFPEAEKRLYTWIIQQRKQGLAVAYITIRSKMLEILKEPEMMVLYGNVSEDFKMLQRWILGFMKRFNLALCRRTRIFQKLPDKTQEQLEKFHQFVKDLRIENYLNWRTFLIWMKSRSGLI